MKHSLKDLNGYLFEQLDALSNSDLTPEELKDEINRSKAITEVAKVVVDSTKVVLEATKHADEYEYKTGGGTVMQGLIEGGNDD